MPDLDKETRDFEPAISQLRTAIRAIPIITSFYLALVFAAIGIAFGVYGVLIGAILGLLLGHIVTMIVVPVYTWMIHVLFLLHSIRKNANEGKHAEAPDLHN